MGNVAILIDYENIHINLYKNFETNDFDYSRLPREIKQIGQENGKVVFARAYADWTTRTRAIITAFGANLIECKHVFPKANGQDRSDVSLVIDAMELLFIRDDIDTFILFSGDSDFRELAIKVESRNKKFVVCGFTSATSEDLKRAADYNFIILEERLKLKRLEDKSLETVPANWKPLIQQISKLGHWNFIGWSAFRDKFLEKIYPDINWNDIGTKDRTGNKDDFLETALSDGLIEQYSAKHMEGNVVAIRLNLNHELVKQVLSAT